jgi:hypothetical protein
MSGWRLMAARTQSGHGDRATALALAVLASKRKVVSYSGPWLATPIPQRQASSPMQELFETHGDAFGPSALMPPDPMFGGWPAGESGDRPL